MKKLVFSLIAMMMFVCTLVPVHAENEGFVPSVSYKDAPTFAVVETLPDGTQVLGYVVDGEGNVLSCVETGCVIITSLEQALDPESKISDSVRTLLVNLYNQLLNGEMKLSKVFPALNDLVAAKYGEHNNADNMVIRDLFNVDFEHLFCKEELEKENTTVTLVLDTKLEEETFFAVARYKNNEWQLLEDYKINEDGNIEITSESFCPVAVFVPGTMNAAPASFNWWLVIIPVALLVVVLVAKKTKKA